MLAEMADDEPDPIILPIEDSLDLHTFAPRDVRSVVGEYLDQAAARGFREVRLVHGKGIGTQRAIVRSVLARHPAVVEFFDGPPERGGWGATVVRLRA
jgi:DNA-nicking Smr family endonuclease